MATNMKPEDWKKLQAMPVYNPVIMRRSENIESSVVSMMSGNTLTPDFAFEDTLNDTDTIGLGTFSKRHDSAIRVQSRLPKEEFLTTLTGCVKEQRFIWEVGWFYEILEKSIVDFCSTLSEHSPDGDLYVRNKKEYVLSAGNGYIYQTVGTGEVIAGAFSGMTLVADSTSGGMTLTLNMPKVIYNDTFGPMSGARFVYTDGHGNVSISFSGSNVTKRGDIYTMTGKRNDRSIAIAKCEASMPWYMPLSDKKELLMDKKLKLPMSKLDMRTDSLIPNIVTKIGVEPRIPMDRALSRMAAIK